MSDLKSNLTADDRDQGKSDRDPFDPQVLIGAIGIFIVFTVGGAFLVALFTGLRVWWQVILAEAGAYVIIIGLCLAVFGNMGGALRNVQTKLAHRRRS